jgi:predicted nucleic acid-binding protein
MCWGLVDEVSEYSEAALASINTSGAVVPHLWYWEVANAVLMCERRGRLTEQDAEVLFSVLEELPITADQPPTLAVFDATLSLARMFRLTVYDAAYLELAQRLSVRLCTLDRQLMAAAAGAGVPLYKHGQSSE